MILKSLILQGFKSFHERTVIEFNQGITAIVGPNGSGKSNITDAIRWVLGEQSMKTLRVNKMDELIFSGSQNRRALSYAEVTLVMDNSDHSLGIDYDEVRITRRIYRSGESDYLINDNKVRLKDITELFLDTGIGKDGYSMIGQGRVDDILSGNSDLRRKMLDEASGISKYKARKQEASRKLQHSEQNLIRINDILSEIEKQKGPLERQAKKASKYLNLREQLKDLDLAYLYYIIENQEEYNQKLNNDILENNKNIEITEAEKAEVIKSSAKHRETIQLTNNKINSLNHNLEELRKTISETEQNMALARQEIKSIDDRASERDQSDGDFQSRLKELRLELEEKTSSLAILIQASSEAKAQLDASDANLKELQSTSNKLQAESSQLAHEETRVNNLLNIAKQNLQNELTNQEVLKQHKNILEHDLEAQEAEFKEQEGNKNNLLSNREQVKTELNAIQAELEDSSQVVDELNKQIAETQNDLQTKQNALTAYEYQVSTQEDLQDSYEGYAYTVKSLMNLVKDTKPDVLGPLASLLNVPAEYETAISSALASNNQNIVVRSETDAQEMIQLLKDKQLGRATFLPINQVHVSNINQDALRTAQKHPGYIGIASDLVDFSGDIKPVVEYALGRTIITEDLDSAVDIAKQTAFKVRIVSLDGDTMNTGGSMSGGSKKKQDNNNALLARNRIIAELNEKIALSKQEIKQLNKEVEAARAQHEKISSEYAAKSALAQDKSDRLLSLNVQIEQLEKSLVKLDSELAQNKADLKHVLEDQSRLSSDLEVKASEADKLEAELAELNKQGEELLEKINSNRFKENALLQEQNEHKVKHTQLLEQQNSATILNQRLQAEEKQIIASINAQEESFVNDSKRKSGLESRIDLYKQNLSQSITSKTQLEDQIAELNRDLEIANDGIESSSDALNTVSTYLAKLGQEQGRLEQKLENAKKELMDQRSRLWQEYNLTFAEKDEWYRDDLDLDSTKEEIDKLRGQIKRLGLVNVNAIDESREVNERYDFTVKQKEDVETAIDDLNDLIKYLTDKMQVQFKESFEFINSHFKEVFKELFGGGEARLVLSDEDDVLNSEIDIEASPPGKKIQNILSLSGGERCLTAIALLFAIQKLNPAPFCVLDEVEAALDEANIFRFADYIVKHSAETQYILVTHRRGTMEAADTIYGVTMPERGVTKLVSLNLKNN